MIFLRLFYEFFKIGMFSFGGGLATIPFLYELSEKTGWFTVQRLTDMIAVSECTPGPIGVNMATYVGYTSAGVLGSIIATLGLISPSIIIIILIADILNKYRNSTFVNGLFTGLRPASIGLMGAAVIAVFKVSLFHDCSLLFTDFFAAVNYKAIILAVVVFFIYRKLKGSPLIYLMAAAIIGIVFKFSI